MNDNELVLIMKKALYTDDSIEYIPLDVIEGEYDENNNFFVDLDGTPYYHIINNPTSLGFVYRDKITDYKQKYPHLSNKRLRKLILKSAKERLYFYGMAKNTDQTVPVILYTKKDFSSKPTLLLDKDILDFYIEKYPEFAEQNLFNETGINLSDNKKINTSKEINLDVQKMYTEITKTVIDQDEPIKKILAAIWKQYNNFSDTKSRNILINGSTGVGKTETFRQITKMLDIPCFMTSATEYSATGYVGKSVEDMLKGLLKNANYDIEKAQKGILIIDEIDKLADSNKSNSQINQRDVQESLLKILEDGVFTLDINNKEYIFNTSKLMIVGMGSWSRIELKETIPIGFDSKPVKKQYKDITREEIVASGMIPELIGRFPTIVQMNELNYDSFIRILNSEGSALTINRNFFSKKGINLTIDKVTIEQIAKKAAKEKYGARSLDEIIETALSQASFEIASNPNTYSELIINEETIKDNKNYTLIRKK